MFRHQEKVTHLGSQAPNTSSCMREPRAGDFALLGGRGGSCWKAGPGSVPGLQVPATQTRVVRALTAGGGSCWGSFGRSSIDELRRTQAPHATVGRGARRPSHCRTWKGRCSGRACRFETAEIGKTRQARSVFSGRKQVCSCLTSHIFRK